MCVNTHKPCVDGSSAEAVVLGLCDKLGVTAITTVGYDHRTDKLAPTEAAIAWLKAHRAHEFPLMVFFDVCPTPPLRSALLEEWAAGSKVRVFVGDHHESEFGAMREYAQAVADAGVGVDAFAMTLGSNAAGVSGVTLASLWAAAVAPEAYAQLKLNPRALADIAATDTTGVTNSFSRFMASLDFRKEEGGRLLTYLSSSDEEYARRCGYGDAEAQKMRDQIRGCMPAVRVLGANDALCPCPPDTVVYLVEYGNPLLANEFAATLWTCEATKPSPSTNGLFIMVTGPTSASLRHWDNTSGFTALAGAFFYADKFQPDMKKKPGGHTGACGMTLPAEAFKILFDAAKPLTEAEIGAVYAYLDAQETTSSS